jgi:hypothetical protein
MKAILSMLLLCSSLLALCQEYEGPSGNSSSGSGDSPLGGWINGEVTTTVSYTIVNFAKCFQVSGDPNEPCPWTIEFADLYDNTWNDDYVRQVYVPEHKRIRFRVQYTFGDGDQTWTDTGTAEEFTRKYEWVINGPVYVEVEDI